ncbi:DNA-binding beta-propeller fold protein YncE [Edaphobacter aggregans]|uniref:DNA-binding beta-propeller fold protein YncE n=2 Tax=Edaphobacter aggregans TaxID=570835 RepID=A0A3R9P8Q1_9BACT|nr:DNA-binding beta-propeller fold protein YncE [Edaphobacter aggregans]
MGADFFVDSESALSYALAPNIERVFPMCQSLEQTVSLGLRRNRPAGLPAVVRSVVLRSLAAAVLLLASSTSFAQPTPLIPPCAPYTAIYPCVYLVDGPTVSVLSATSRALVGVSTMFSYYPSGGLAVTPDNATVYVAVSGSNSGSSSGFAGVIKVIDTKTGVNSLPDIPLQTNVVPSQVAISPDGRFVWVVEPPCSDGCDPGVEVIDTANNNMRTTITDSNYPDPNHPFPDPRSIALSPDGKLAYVADACTVNGSNIPCLVVVDTSTKNILKTINIPNSVNIPSPEGTAHSVAVTPDGKLVCVSVTILDPTNKTTPQSLGVAFIDPVSGNVNPVTALVDAVPSDFGIVITSTGELYAAAPMSSNAASLNHVYVFDVNSQTFTGTVTVGSGPTGVAVGSDGQTVYVTNLGNGNLGSVSIIRSGVLLASPPTASSFPQGVAAMPSIPPAITTQPSGQQIPYGGTATAAIQATGTAPLTYQWYQGQSGDTSDPVQGATGSSFTTPVLIATTSYWVRVTNIVTNQDSTALTVTVSPPLAPTITTQPVAPVIAIGGTATLTVQAGGTLPLSYQWFQGTSGDTSMPQQGATGPSFTTPPLNANTSYWVQVSNVASNVNSIAVTISVSPVPQCALQLQAAGITGPTISATATCKDVTNPPLQLATTLDWGDQTPTVTMSGGSLTPTHTYLSADNYVLTVKGVNTLNLEGDKTAYLNLKPLVLSPPLVVFQGQSASFVAGVSSPGPVQVNFECTVLVSSSGVVSKASDLGISCYAMSQPITLSESRSNPTQVTIIIQTTGGALARLSPGPAHQGMLYTCLLPVSGVIIMVGGALSSRRRRISSRFLAILSVLLLLGPIVSCGGGFTAPKSVQTGTSAGSYQISVVDVLTNTSPNAGAFVQTTLIVPLQIVPFQ